MGPLGSLPAGTQIALAGLLGLIVGSFLNVVIHRLPLGESIVSPGSRCPHCRRAIPAWENVPLLSYLVLRGRCRGCGAAISWRYPAVEALTGALFAAIAARYGATLETLVWFAFTAALIAAAVIDLDHRIIPDEISVGGLVLALLCVPALEAYRGTPPSSALGASLLGALLGGGMLWLVGFAHARISVAAGRRFEHWPGQGEAPPSPSSLDYWVWFPGVGFGDVKLLAMIGAVLGPIGVVEAILVASCAGLALGLAWVAVSHRWNAPFGFGPAIAFGALFVVLAPFRLI